MGAAGNPEWGPSGPVGRRVDKGAAPSRGLGAGAWRRGGQWLTAVFPKAGFSTPMTLTLLPLTFTGTWTGA